MELRDQSKIRGYISFIILKDDLVPEVIFQNPNKKVIFKPLLGTPQIEELE